jgi:hypothetical protein
MQDMFGAISRPSGKQAVFGNCKRPAAVFGYEASVTHWISFG